MSNSAESEGEFLGKLVFLFQICTAVPHCQTYCFRTVYSYKSLLFFSCFLGIPNPSTFSSDSGYSYSLKSLCFLLSKQAVPDKHRQAILFYQIIALSSFCPVVQVCGTPGNNVFPILPLRPSPHGLPANSFSLNAGSVIFIQPCQGLLSNCSGIWSDRIMERKTDLCTFCFLKTDEQGLTGLLKHNSNTGP